MDKKDGLNPNFILVALGLALLFMFLGKTYFIGSLVTTCENYEPNTLADYKASIEAMNGSVETVASEAEQRFVNSTYVVHKATGPLGTFNIINTEGPCSTFLASVDQAENDTSYVLINKFQVLLIERGFLWCNYANNYALLAESSTTLNNYYSEYEACSTETVDDIPVSVPDSNETGTDDDSDDDTSGGTSSDDDRETTPTPGEDSNSTNTTNTTNTNFNTGTTNTGASADTEDRKFDIQLSYAGIIALALFLLYWMFEKGPDKGLIKKKRRRR